MNHEGGKAGTRMRGLTLVELLVVLSVVAILAAVATPSLRVLLAGSEVRAAVNDWMSALYLARSEAVRQRSEVTLCPSEDGSTCASTNAYDVGWIVKTGNATAPGTVLMDIPPLRRVAMLSNATSSAAITYRANGLPGSSLMTITVKDRSDAGIASVTRCITLARTGSARVWAPGSGATTCAT